jgi:glycopeptide antibiotics resistance protein
LVLNFLIENRWVTSLLLVSALMLSPLVGVWLSRRPGLACAATILAGLGVLIFVLTPVDRELFAVRTVEWSPLSLGRVELVANLLLFVPLSLCGAVWSFRPAASVVVASIFSLAIEVVQAAAPALGRSCSTNDWLYNTVGAMAGGVLGAVALRLSRRQRPGPDRRMRLTP